MAVAVILFLAGHVDADDHDTAYRATLVKTFDAPDARQGVAVDKQHFYAVNNSTISKYDKTSGNLVAQWPGQAQGNVLIHMDSLMAFEGRLYASHSNYPGFPMTSSVEVWDADTLQHVDSHSFGVLRGSLTWLDRHDGFWWGAFANYDTVQKGQLSAYGLTDRTQVVRFDDNFNVLEAWTLPLEILNRIRPMSNSGGSWGPDGYLYLTGHDHGEIYVTKSPQAGAVLRLVTTIEVPLVEGQGIAWDRAEPGRFLWGITKRDRKVIKLEMPKIRQAVPQRFK